MFSMSRRRREPDSLRRQFARQLLWMALVLLTFYACLALEGPQRFGEWFAQFYTPGR
jgi:hypothetical protein